MLFLFPGYILRSGSHWNSIFSFLKNIQILVFHKVWMDWLAFPVAVNMSPFLLTSMPTLVILVPCLFLTLNILVLPPWGILGSTLAAEWIMAIEKGREVPTSLRIGFPYPHIASISMESAEAFSALKPSILKAHHWLNLPECYVSDSRLSSGIEDWKTTLGKMPRMHGNLGSALFFSPHHHSI